MTEQEQETKGEENGIGSKTLNMPALSKQLRDLDAKVNALQAENDELKAKTATPMVQGKEKAEHTPEQIEKFLNKVPDPYHLFARGIGPQIALFKGIRKFDEVTRIETVTPALHIKDLAEWTGVGRDIPDPKNPGMPKYEWGHVHLDKLPQVKSGDYKIEDVVAAIEQCGHFKNDIVFWEAQVIEDLRDEYADLRRETARLRKIEERLLKRRQGAHKLGEMPVEPEKEAVPA